MKITKVEAFPVYISLNKAFATSKFGYMPTSKKKHVIVIIHTDEEINGIGEAAPEPVFHGETQESILHNIRKYIGPCLIGEDPFNLEAIFEKLRRTLVENPYAVAAIDFALYDILGKKTCLPACKLLGGLYREKIPIAFVISLSSRTEDIATESQESIQKGFKTLKIKVGVDPKQDIERVKTVREAVENNAEIRVDANQGWSATQAIKIIKKMEKFELQLVEQPVPSWDLEGMARVARTIDTPIMADESVFSPQSALKVIRMEAADILNIKVLKPGGLYNSKKVAMLAEAANIPCIVGSMLEVGIGTAAGAHFAAANKIVEYACEMIGPMYLEEDIVKEDLRPKDGYIRVPSKPGLGVDLDQNALRKLMHC